MPMVEDFTAFFQANEFASAATLAGLPVVGIFDRAFLDAGMASSTPMMTLPSASVPASPVGQQLVITQGQGIGTWRIATAEPDGTGITQLALERAS